MWWFTIQTGHNILAYCLSQLYTIKQNAPNSKMVGYSSSYKCWVEIPEGFGVPKLQPCWHRAPRKQPTYAREMQRNKRNILSYQTIKVETPQSRHQTCQNPPLAKFIDDEQIEEEPEVSGSRWQPLLARMIPAIKSSVKYSSYELY